MTGTQYHVEFFALLHHLFRPAEPLLCQPEPQVGNLGHGLKDQVHLILQPMTKIPDLRLWLAQQGFGWSEQVVQEGKKFYVILSARHTGTVSTLSSLEQEIG